MSGRPKDSALAKRFGDRLYRLRKTAGLSCNQVHVALSLGKSGALRSYEQGIVVPTLPIVISLANLYGVSVDDLIAPVTPEDPVAS